MTQVSSLSLTKFILWGRLPAPVKELATGLSYQPQLLSALPHCSAMITQGSVREVVYFQLSGLRTGWEDCVCHKSVAKLIKIDSFVCIFGFPLFLLLLIFRSLNDNFFTDLIIEKRQERGGLKVSLVFCNMLILLSHFLQCLPGFFQCSPRNILQLLLFLSKECFLFCCELLCRFFYWFCEIT